jgi:hypothetical protein
MSKFKIPTTLKPDNPLFPIQALPAGTQGLDFLLFSDIMFSFYPASLVLPRHNSGRDFTHVQNMFYLVRSLRVVVIIANTMIHLSNEPQAHTTKSSTSCPICGVVCGCNIRNPPPERTRWICPARNTCKLNWSNCE